MIYRRKKLEQIEADKQRFILIYRSRIGDYDRLIAELETMNRAILVKIFCPHLRRRIVELQKEREGVLQFVQTTLLKFDHDLAEVAASYYFGRGGKFSIWFNDGRARPS